MPVEIAAQTTYRKPDTITLHYSHYLEFSHRQNLDFGRGEGEEEANVKIIGWR